MAESGDKEYSRRSNSRVRYSRSSSSQSKGLAGAECVEHVSGMYQYPIVGVAEVPRAEQQQVCVLVPATNVVFMPLSYPDLSTSYPYASSATETPSGLCDNCSKQLVKKWESTAIAPKSSNPSDPPSVKQVYGYINKRAPKIKEGLGTAKKQAECMRYILKDGDTITNEDIPAIAGEVKSYQEKLEEARHLTEDLSRAVDKTSQLCEDNRFLINESPYLPGPWPAQVCPVSPPLTSIVKKKLGDLASEVSELEHKMACLQLALEETKVCNSEGSDDVKCKRLPMECPPCAKAAQKMMKKGMKVAQSKSKTDYDVSSRCCAISRGKASNALKDLEKVTQEVSCNLEDTLLDITSKGTSRKK